VRHDGIKVGYARVSTFDRDMRIRLDGLERLGVGRVCTDGDRAVYDVVDPHRHDLDITSPKWAAHAWYADEHSGRVRNVLAVVKNPSSKIRALNPTTSSGIAEKFEAANNKDLRLPLFEPEDMAY